MVKVCRHGLEWCGECYEKRTRGGVSEGGPRMPSGLLSEEVRAVSVLHRVEGGGNGQPRPPAAVGDPFAKENPALWEYLTVDRWPDGKVRETATITIMFEEGRWKGCLHDRANSRSCWRSGASLSELIASLEDAMTDPAAEWRKSRPQGWGRRR